MDSTLAAMDAFRVEARFIARSGEKPSRDESRSHGSIGVMADVNFTQEAFHSRYATQIRVPEELQGLPDAVNETKWRRAA